MKTKIKIISAYVLYMVITIIGSNYYISSNVIETMQFLPEKFNLLVIWLAPITGISMVSGIIVMLLYRNVFSMSHKSFWILFSFIPISIVIFSIFSIVIIAKSPWVVDYLPFIILVVIIMIVEMLHHRNISEKDIEKYTYDNTPRWKAIYDVMDVRGKNLGFILIYLALLIFFVWAYYHTRFENSSIQSVYAIVSLLILVLYAIVKMANDLKRILTWYFYALIGIIVLATGIFFLVKYLGSQTETNVEISIEIVEEIKVDTLITTKTGSEWTKIENDYENYYHVVKKGESLEYIFNDIQLSLEKAKEQNFNILKKEDGKMKIIPITDYDDELEDGTYLYSGLYIGDTVYLSKYELERFEKEKGLN